MPSELEWKTRKERIDKKLKAMSPAWKIIPYSEGMDFSSLERHAVTEIPTETGPADYGLIVNGQLLGILEAKKVSVSPQNVLEQAKRYSKGAKEGPGQWGEYRVPFLYASNGEQIWFLDVRNSKATSRTLFNFHTPSALSEHWEKENDSAHQLLKNTPIEQINAIRPYQKKALESVEGAIIKNQRHMLVAMATGTGKTFTTVSQVYRLLKSGTAKRILFLVDRKA
ncbi:MAG: DEAD/DEAH box helicase family protein, partial [Bacteroidetes bacterium]|nr:DEAD/DEAH box helicase family protein [Bacteroidota bacterium]